ncbi:M23 family metallopeptidase [Mesobacillus zeae]|uniref:M23 family peptidase n=1 Tax=Mesobacillus zeae TaxID=1917180 RepID=A0A398B6H3_9BACI|nr:M23 family metallopeptidase [Mesobacillus zeae]RID83283.1 M23 family peptidase [Mesobacillus zeae]
MGSRADDIRKRIEKRKKDRERSSKRGYSGKIPETEELYGFAPMPAYETSPGEGNHPVFSKEVFLFKLLFSACLVLVVSILFRSGPETAAPAKKFVASTMEKEFQFAMVSDWYEQQFGKPLALLPQQVKIKEKSNNVNNGYALPASGKILEEFGDDGQKITIETGNNANVEAMSGGLVRFAGNKEGFGKTVIIQHADKSESWYGNLSGFDVNVYEYVKKGEPVGKTTSSDDGSKGSFYFAIKKGDDFIDPMPVIKFE